VSVNCGDSWTIAVLNQKEDHREKYPYKSNPGQEEDNVKKKIHVMSEHVYVARQPPNTRLANLGMDAR
jgi:hypothetical protein